MAPRVKKTTSIESETEHYKALLIVDKQDLDSEIEQQAVLFHEVAEKLALAISIRDELKEQLQKTDAEVADELRHELTKKEERWSEQRIGDLVLGEADHQRAQAAYNEAVKRVALLTALRDSFRMRADMIQELSRLFASGYWTMTSITGARQDTTKALAVAGKEGMSQARKTSSMYRRRSTTE